MSYVVSKPFRTVNQVFNVGDPVGPDIVLGAALTFDILKVRGFIVERAPAVAPAPTFEAHDDHTSSDHPSS